MPTAAEELAQHSQAELQLTCLACVLSFTPNFALRLFGQLSAFCFGVGSQVLEPSVIKRFDGLMR